MSESKAQSWVEVSENSDFPIQNLPYGAFRSSKNSAPHIGVAIGEYVLDLNVLAQNGFFDKAANFKKEVFMQGTLNDFMASGKPAWSEARAILTELLSESNTSLKDNESVRQAALLKQSEVEMLMPARIGDYTDFYSSKNHAYNVGVMIRGKENALQPNWTWLPVGYHGRASSVVVSGTDVVRPRGQICPEAGKPPVFAECKALDFELEMAFFVGPGNKLGEPLSIDEVEDQIFGYVLMNDWSARDIQTWEYVPLGPFLAKNFATTISPWIVTAAALEPFKLDLPAQEPEPLSYLKPSKHSLYNYDIKLEVGLKTPQMDKAHTISTSNAKYLYWTFEQQLAHHAVNGCNMQPGDLLGSGTISGPEPHEYGCLLELTWKGTKEITLPDGTTRKYLRDGDELQISGFAEREGVRIGFGSCVGKVLPAPALKQ